MNAYSIIVTIGMICAAWMFEPNLLWVVGIAALAQIITNFINDAEDAQKILPENEIKVTLDDFTASFRHSVWSKFFDREEAREKIMAAGTRELVAIYRGIKPMIASFDLTHCDESGKQEATRCIANLEAIGEIILNEIADRQIEAYHHSKRKKDVNYAKRYAESLKAHLFSENLTDEQVLEDVAKIPADSDLVHIVLDTDQEIFNTTEEHTTGCEEEAEAYYHNNLRKIQFLLRRELAKRVITKESRHRFF